MLIPIVITLSFFLGGPVSSDTLESLPEAMGGDPVGIWDADSLDIDVYATPTLLAAISDLALSGIVDGQVSFEPDGGYRSEYQVDVDVALTFLGGPLAVSLIDTVSASGTYVLDGHSLILTASTGEVDTVGFTVLADTLRLIQEVPLGEFSTLVSSVDPDGGPPLAVLKLARVSGEAGAADFDGNGSVGFEDFLAFAAGFGKQAGEAGFDIRFDLDADGTVGFTDFLVFVSQFGG